MHENIPADINNIIVIIEQRSESWRTILRNELLKAGWVLEPVKTRPVTKEVKQPRWDRFKRTLFLGSKICRRYSRESKNQFAVLDAFEKSNWTELRNGEYPRHLTGQRIWDTISRLNKHQSDIWFQYSGQKKRSKDESIWCEVIDAE